MDEFLQFLAFRAQNKIQTRDVGCQTFCEIVNNASTQTWEAVNAGVTLVGVASGAGESVEEDAGALVGVAPEGAMEPDPATPMNPPENDYANIPESDTISIPKTSFGDFQQCLEVLRDSNQALGTEVQEYTVIHASENLSRENCR